MVIRIKVSKTCKIEDDFKILGYSFMQTPMTGVGYGWVERAIAHKGMADQLKVTLSQMILGNFYIANINIPYHYPEQKI